MPQHACGCIDIMIRHTLPVGLINIAHMYDSITHLIFSAADECVDTLIHGLIAHCMYMHGQTFFISLARNVRSLLFRPVDEALMPVWI